MEDRVFNLDHGVCTVMIKKVCREVNDDTQETILKRYSHMFEGDGEMVIEALRWIEKNSITYNIHKVKIKKRIDEME